MARNAAFLAQLGVPAPIPLSGCSVSVNCACASHDTYTISCTGTTTCRDVPVGPPGHMLVGVECDGVIQQVCPGPANC